MGTLRSLAQPEVPLVYLHYDHDVGRSPRCGLVLAHPRASTYHARIRWSGRRWEVRDLGSRHGTTLNDEAIATQSWHPLRRSDRLVFGDPSESWCLVDASPPAALLIPAVGEPIELSAVSLPISDDPRSTIFQLADGTFALEEDGGEHVKVRSGDRIVVGGRELLVHLPGGGDIVLTSSAEASAITRSLRSAVVRLVASRDEENAEAIVEHGEDQLTLPPRAHLYLLLQLARVRTQHSDDGWVACEALCRDLRITATQLALQVFRVREDFKRIGFYDAGEVVDRRRRGWIRIGLRPDQLQLARAP
jgi:hypothetical protein